MDAESAAIHRRHDFRRIEAILRWTREDGTKVNRETIAEARESYPHIAIEKVGACCRRWRQSLDEIERIIADLP